MHGIQAWVALPEGLEEIEPAFSHHGGDALPTFEADGVSGRLIAGRAFGAVAPAPVHSPLFYVHWALKAGARGGVPADYPERAAYVAKGRVRVDGREFGHGRMLVFAPGETVTIEALEDSTVMLLGGEPIGPRHIWWNFVSSSKARIEQAKADWSAGRIPLPPHDHDEFIPLPEEPPPAPAMS
jgi:redox-sensitive bicupin YhaK (pirin superfamily)